MIAGIDSSEVTKLILRDNNLKGDQVMSKLMDCNAKLEELDLSENDIGKHVLNLRFYISDKNS